jgi:outer membrane autotransporter protein
MSFHATAAAASARPNRISTFRNHLLCSVCAAMLLAGSGGMAWADYVPIIPSQEVPATVPAASKAADEPSPLPPAQPSPETAASAPEVTKPDPAAGGTALADPAAATPALPAQPVAETPSQEVPATAPPASKAADEPSPLPSAPAQPAAEVTRPGPVTGEVPAPIEKTDTPKAERITIKSGETRAATPSDKDESFTVENGGTLNAWAGGLAKDVLVQGVKAWDVVTGLGGTGGIAYILGEGSHLESGTVNLGGYLTVKDKAAADTITVRNGGKLDVYNGGAVKDLTVEGVKAWDSVTGLGGIGGIAFISGEGSRLEGGTVDLGGYLQVKDKATAGTVTVRNGGRLDVLNGSTVKDLTVEGIKAWRISDTMDAAGVLPVVDGIGGVAFISGEGSRLEGGTVDLGGLLQVVNQAAAGTVTVRNGGQLDVYNGGFVKDLTVEGVKAWDSATGLGGIGGLALLFGEKSHLESGTVDLGGGLAVGNRAAAGTVTVHNGGKLDVLAEGRADNVNVNGGYARTYGHIGTATVDNDGRLLVLAGGAITGKSTIGYGGILGVGAEGKAGDIDLNGGDSNSPTSYAVVGGTAGDIAISGNAVLNGTGTVRNVRVHAGGKVFPGSAVDKFATLTATGNVMFDRDSFFNVQIANDGLRSNKLAAQGQATLDGGSVKVLAEDFAGTDSQGVALTRFLSQQQIKNLFQKSFVILTAEKGVTGRFEKVEPQTNYNYITPSLSYTDKTVSVDFGLNGAVKTQSAEEQVKHLVLVDAVTPNQKSTGHAVLQLGLGNRLLQTVLLSKKGEVLHYETLSGEAHATLRGTLLQDAGLVSGAASERVRAAFDGVAAKAAPVATPLAYGPDARAKDKQSAGEAFAAATPAVSTTALWGQAYGGWSHGSSDGNAAAYNRNTGGIVTGVDALIAETWRLGVLAGYGSTSLHGAGSSISAGSYQVGIYGGTKVDALTLSLGTILAHHEIDTRRKVSFGPLDETETAGYSANTVQLFGEAAYRIDTPYAALEPFAAAAYTHLKTSGFTETGGIAALSAPSSTTDLTTTTLGLRASRAFTLGNATSLTARGMAGWRHAYGDVTPQAQLAFASGGESFDVSGLPIASDAALVEAGLAFDIGKATTLGLTYTGQFSNQVNDNSVKADLTVRF